MSYDVEAAGVADQVAGVEELLGPGAVEAASRCTRLDGDGPVTVGVRYENVQHLAGHDSTIVYTVTEYEPGSRIVLEGGNDTVRSRDEMTFTPTPDGGTEVTYTVDIELTGAARLAQPVMPIAMKKIADEGATGMRNRLLAL